MVAARCGLESGISNAAEGRLSGDPAAGGSVMRDLVCAVVVNFRLPNADGMPLDLVRPRSLPAVSAHCRDIDHRLLRH
jgi:hypothetical protein